MSTDVHLVTSVHDLAEFELWVNGTSGPRAVMTVVNTRSPYVSGFSIRLVSFGAADGSAFLVDAADRTLVRAALTMAIQSPGKWWSYGAVETTERLSAAFGVSVRGLMCASALVKTFQPEHIQKETVSLDRLRPEVGAALDALHEHWMNRVGGAVAGNDWFPAAVLGLSAQDVEFCSFAAAEVTEVARLVAEWGERSSGPQRALAVVEARTEGVWGAAAARGYRVDTPMLERMLAAVEVVRAQSFDEFGLDLVSDSEATKRWLRARGIRVTDSAGRESLSHKSYAGAHVPDTAAADWNRFVSIRQASRNSGKLREIRRHTDDVSRVYPRIHGIGAHTGRSSIRNPALQNLPSDLRPLLLADDGCVLLACDLDRVEPRVIAALSGDPHLALAVRGDLYSALAKDIWGEVDGVRPENRKIAKTAFLAMLYGQGPESLAYNLCCTVEEAKEVLDGIKRAYPVMARWMNGVKKDAKNGVPLRTGTARPLPPTRGAPYKAVNWLIQGTAADLFKRNVLAVVDELGTEPLWLPIHDELILQVPEAQKETALEVLRTAMTTEFMGISMSGTPDVLGDRWAKV